MENYKKLITELCKLPNETQWVEFKHNNYEPKMIGEDISALANSATIHDKEQAYMVWGIDDKTHEIVGTNYDLQTLKKGSQELENWLRSLLSNNADFEFHKVEMNNVTVGLLIIYRATYQPVKFDKAEYIRVGSYTKNLNDHPQLSGQLWDKLRSGVFEEEIAMKDLDLSEALNYLSYSTYFDLLEKQIPSDNEKISHYLLEEGIIVKQDNALYSITNLGAMLFAKRLDDFPRLSRKAIRVVQYEGDSRVNMIREISGKKGYIVGLEGLLDYITALLPTKEVINGAVRETRSAYPPLAIREVIGNAIIHQDFSVKGTSPVIEIFDKRIEITNPGTPLIDINRIIDNPPKSRNEKLASLMRRVKLCEELGTGWDKITIHCEYYKLPAPTITVYENNTKVTLYSEKPFSSISQEDRLWACYLHACIKHVEGQELTNASLRERFGLKDSSSGNISRLITSAVNAELIKPLDPTTAPRYMKYIPYWA